jgi:cytochrome d ubiquinol oxidase subunit I
MQHPVGFVIRNGRAELDDLIAVIAQPFAWHTIVHTVSAAYILSAFFVMGVSAWHLLRRQHISFFKKSFRLAVSLALIFTIVEVVQGHMHGGEVAKIQPTKLAAMESLWETKKSAPQYLLVIPDPDHERNLLQFGAIPGALSMLAYHDFSAEVKGLKAFAPSERPPVTFVFVSFRLMMMLGFFFLVMAIIGWLRRNTVEERPKLLKVFLYSIPLPYLASEFGWMLAEVGRQPWVVYGIMKTSSAVSPIAPSQVAISFGAFVLVYTFLGIVAYYLMWSHAKKGPVDETALSEVDDEEVGYA